MARKPLNGDNELDKRYMRLAIEQAKLCPDPKKFGTIIVDFGTSPEGVVIAEAFSTVSTDHDFTQHAEIKAISAASRYFEADQDRLRKCVLYATCEPCMMCTGAIFWSRIGQVVYGIKQIASQHNFWHSHFFHRNISSVLINPVERPYIVEGILAWECLQLLPPPEPALVQESRWCMESNI